MLEMRKTKYTKDFLESIVKRSKSMSDVLRAIGLKPVGSMFRIIKAKCEAYEISTTHFTGRLWSKGETARTNEHLATIVKRNTNDENLFCQNSLRKIKILHLLNLGWKYECNICKLDEWMGKAITLHIDHINGTHNDNRLTNIQLLCPNCHQQTVTWGNRKGEIRDYRFFKTDNHKYVQKPYNERKIHNKACFQCKKDFYTANHNAKYCSYDCAHLSRRKNIPNKQQLLEDFEKLKTFVCVAKKYNVSDNAVRKWYKKYELYKCACQSD